MAGKRAYLKMGCSAEFAERVRQTARRQHRTVSSLIIHALTLYLEGCEEREKVAPTPKPGRN